MSYLHKAAKLGRIQHVRSRLKQGDDVNLLDADRNTPLMHAASAGHLDIVKLLISAGAEVNPLPNYDGDTPLLLATSAGHLDIVKLLISAGADLNGEGGMVPPLVHMLGTRDLQAMRLLLDVGADVNARGPYEMTPLHFAASGGAFEAARLLLERGADPSLLDEKGRKPSDLAIKWGYPGIARFIFHGSFRTPPTPLARFADYVNFSAQIELYQGVSFEYRVSTVGQTGFVLKTIGTREPTFTLCRTEIVVDLSNIARLECLPWFSAPDLAGPPYS